jgi:hypothetical protein
MVMVTTPAMEEAWSKTKRSIFRLEALPAYSVQEDLALFEKWKRGRFELDGALREWLQKLKRAKDSRMSIQRVRVVQLPISDYIRYEMDFWKHSIRSGEEITFIESEKYKELTKGSGLEPMDFWMFDDRILVLFHYDRKGGFAREELVSDDDIVRKYKEFKKVLLKIAIPMEEFIKAHIVTM